MNKKFLGMKRINVGESQFGRRRQWTPISNLILDDESLTCQEKIIYWVLLRHGQVSGECWPGLELIAEESGVEIRSVRKALKSLEDKKWIEIIRVPGGVNHYCFLKKDSLVKLV